MKITYDWLKDHISTNKSEKELLKSLTDVGLEVEGIENILSELENFKIAKIIKIAKHPNADRLKVCDVDVGEKEIIKVVCGATNAKEGLLTIYAPPGSIIPKNKMKLEISKIRGVTSYGMLCSESELNLSNNSEGICDLEKKQYQNKIGKKFFSQKNQNLIDLSITPNRPDCLGFRGIARDLAATSFGKLKKQKIEKIRSRNKQKISIKILKEKNSGCSVFGSCLISGVQNVESPKWLKDKLASVGQKSISAIVDITNYVMFDLNRPLHAYDADKIQKGIIVRNSKKGEKFLALDNREYELEKDMCVISDYAGVLGLGGIIGGIRSSTEFTTKNVLIESAYFEPRSIRKTSKYLNIDTDAKFRFERGIDPLSIEEGLNKAAQLIKRICGGEVSKIDIKRIKKYKEKIIKLNSNLFEKISGFKIPEKKVLKILVDLGFSFKKRKDSLILKVPSWRPDIQQPIDIVEELMRVNGYDKIKKIDPPKIRTKSTLNNSQKLFHFLQRSIATKGYKEAITWSFTDSKINDLFRCDTKNVEIINPISSDLNVLRNSIFSNLIINLNKNLDRGFKDVMMFEIGPTFYGANPGEQQIVIGGLRSGKISRLSWLEKDRNVDVFDIKKDVIQTLVEVGYHKSKIFIDDKTPNYYHPGKSGRIFLSKDENIEVANFGEIHPNILKKLDVRTEALVGFEIFLDNFKEPRRSLKDRKPIYKISDFQKSERDFAFIIDKSFEAQKLIDLISSIDKSLIQNVRIFDIYEGQNIPDDKKSIALNVTIQSMTKSLTDNDLDKLNRLIIDKVENQTGAKIRS